MFHRNEEYKAMFGTYLMEDLVHFQPSDAEKPLVITLLSFLAKAIPKFHKVLDLGHDSKNHKRLDDRL